MKASPINHMNIRLLSVITTSILSVALLPTISIAKPSISKSTVSRPENITNISNLGGGVKFTFQSCNQIPSQEKVICTGTIRSSNGEQLLTIYRDYDKDRLQQVKITDSKGRSYLANEFRVGDEYICQYDSNTNWNNNNCTNKEMTLVEGVDYKTIFTFTEIALPSPKIPLLLIGFSIRSVSYQSYHLKYRNIPVAVDSTDLPNSQNKRDSKVNQ
jgi:hypothetical protein